MPIPRVCKHCKKKFSVKPFWVKRGAGIYCSAKCQHLGKRNGKMMPCYICDKITYKAGKALRHSKSQKFFCSKSCQTKWRNSEFIGEKHANYTTGRSSYQTVLTRHKVPAICKMCSTTDRRVLVTHHIDKNRTNNKLSNLVWLCHNCHFLVHYHKGMGQKLMGLMV